MLLSTVWNLLVNEDGPTAVEYAVLLALILLACIVAIGNLGTTTNAWFTDVANKT